MTEATFWEVGASGLCYSREYVLDELEKRYADPTDDAWQTSDFHCLEIADVVDSDRGQRFFASVYEFSERLLE